MKLIRNKVFATIVLLMLSAFCNKIQAQGCAAKGSSVKWKSPDSFFSVEVPEALKQEDSSYDATKTYGVIIGECVFVVFVHHSPLNKTKGKETFDERVGGIEFVIGGDDDHEFTEQLIKVGKFQAKKIVYAKQNTQGLIVDAGDYIFVVGFTSKNRKNLKSKVAKKFFSSFRVSPTIIDI